MEILILLAIWIGCGVIASAILESKGRGACTGMALGFLLGPIGVVVALVLSPAPAAAAADGPTKKCPACAETIKLEARKCRYCGTDLPHWNPPPER